MLLSKEREEEMQQIIKRQTESRRSDWFQDLLKKTAKTGLTMCPNGKCRSKKTITQTMQTRSADEPMTELVHTKLSSIFMGNKLELDEF